MNFIFPLILVVAFCFLILYIKWFSSAASRKYIWIILFLLKLAGGAGVYVVYKYYYDYNSSDIRKYMRGGEVLYSSAEESTASYLRLVTGIQGDRPELFKYKDATNFWTREHNYGLYNDDRTIMRFNALVYPISRGNIYVHIVLMAFISFLGCFALFKAFNNLLPRLNKYLLVFACFLVPSCLFWTSGLLKEGLMMFSLGFTFYFFVGLIRKFRITYLIGFILFSGLLIISKIYVYPALLPALLFMFITKKMNIKKQFITLVSLFAVCVVFVVFSKQIIGYDIINTISGKQNDFLNFLEIQEDKGSSFELTRLEPDAKSLFRTIPEGLINSFFKPFIRDINSPLTLFSFLEVIFISITALIAIIFFKKPGADTLRFVLFSAIFILLLYSVIGVYTPNIGALVRYRTPALPFLVALIFSLTDWDKISDKFLNKNRERRGKELSG